MNIKDIYVVEVFIPTECSMSIESGITELILCKKYGESYIDLKSGKSYIIHNEIGYTKVIRAVPLSEYYYTIGIKRNNNHNDKKDVHTLVKKAKHQGMI